MATQADTLKSYVSTVVNGGFLDPLDDDALLAYAQREISIRAYKVEQGDWVTFHFPDDNSSAVYDRAPA